MLAPLGLMKLRTAKLAVSGIGAAFGPHVRGARGDYGWDLDAPVGTPCRAIANGEISFAHHHDTGDFGKYVLLSFDHRGRKLYALYAHLSQTSGAACGVRQGDVVGWTGLTGNARKVGVP